MIDHGTGVHAGGKAEGPVDEQTKSAALGAAGGKAEDARLMAVVTAGADTAGGKAAFAALYGKYAPKFAMVCRARLIDPASAEDAVQETMLRLFEFLRRGGAIDDFEAYGVRLAQRACAALNQAATTPVEQEPQGAAEAGTGVTGENGARRARIVLTEPDDERLDVTGPIGRPLQPVEEEILDVAMYERVASALRHLPEGRREVLRYHMELPGARPPEAQGGAYHQAVSVARKMIIAALLIELRAELRAEPGCGALRALIASTLNERVEGRYSAKLLLEIRKHIGRCPVCVPVELALLKRGVRVVPFLLTPRALEDLRSRLVSGETALPGEPVPIGRGPRPVRAGAPRLAGPQGGGRSRNRPRRRSTGRGVTLVTMLLLLIGLLVQAGPLTTFYDTLTGTGGKAVAAGPKPGTKKHKKKPGEKGASPAKGTGGTASAGARKAGGGHGDTGEEGGKAGARGGKAGSGGSGGDAAGGAGRDGNRDGAGARTGGNGGTDRNGEIDQSGGTDRNSGTDQGTDQNGGTDRSGTDQSGGGAGGNGGSGRDTTGDRGTNPDGADGGSGDDSGGSDEMQRPPRPAPRQEQPQHSHGAQNPVPVPATPTYVLTLRVTGPYGRAGVIVAGEALGTCSEDSGGEHTCTYSVAEGARVSIEVPDGEVNWLAGPCSGGRSCSFTMDRATTVALSNYNPG
ncbi:RNA polymerase sigma factor [Sphaerisporangium sp. NPDC051017]|uniref:RNA polymerase sigma factor n=1 Tax=Sphaerisporangium sp. NPDC051017 TaxID=3154636 RepID=UPI00342FF6F8